MTTKGAHYTPRVGARAELAKELQQAKHEARVRAAGLTAGDLDVVKTQGETAKEADRQQHEQLAGISAERSGRSINAAEVLARDAALRDRMSAVVHELEEGSDADKGQARWLSALTFARYRVRELHTPAVEAQPIDPDVKKVERVEREDIPTRLDGLAAFCAALRKTGRESIVAKLAERAMDGAALDALGADADALARAGRNVSRAAEATAREQAAAAAQKKRWIATRRMFANAAAGDAELSILYAACS